MSDEPLQDALLFFSEQEARTIEAISARVIPGTPDDPGARQAGVVYYIDRALAGFHRDLQTLYRNGLRLLAERCHGFGATFPELPEDEQDRVLRELESEKTADGGRTPAALFFAVVRQHVIHGLFGDPAYGGNRDYVGWKLVGFPGAQWEYSPEQMEPGFDARTIPIISLADLRRRQAIERTAGRQP